MKACITCNKEKPENKDNFSWRKDTNCFRNECKLCRNKKIIEKKLKSKDPIEQPRKRKACNTCKKLKSLTLKNYYWRKDSNNFNHQCRTCNNNKVKKWYKKNFESKLLKSAAWKKSNEDYYKKQQNNYRLERLKIDPIYKLRRNISGQFRSALKSQSINKNGSTFKLFGYTPADIKEHLEKQFEPWMNWDNYGVYKVNWDDNDSTTWTWNIDHKKPVSTFNLKKKSEIKKCWALENLRPYSAKQNLLDGNRR